MPYNASRVCVKRQPPKVPRVIPGPGESGGVVAIGDGLAALFKMESHNHPSFIEPYQGAATGVGGILRDVFTMGARPIANLNALRFGSPDNPRTKRVVDGVVRGIGGYGNCVGVPTVAWEALGRGSRRAGVWSSEWRGRGTLWGRKGCRTTARHPCCIV